MKIKRFVAFAVWLAPIVLIFTLPRIWAQDSAGTGAAGTMQVTQNNRLLGGGRIALLQVTVCAGGSLAKSNGPVATTSLAANAPAGTGPAVGDVGRPIVAGQNWNGSQPGISTVATQQTASVSPGQTTVVASTQTETVGGATLSIGAVRTVSVGTGQTTVVGSAQTEGVGGATTVARALQTATTIPVASGPARSGTGKAPHGDSSPTKQVDMVSPRPLTNAGNGQSSNTLATAMPPATTALAGNAPAGAGTCTTCAFDGFIQLGGIKGLPGDRTNTAQITPVTGGGSRVTVTVTKKVDASSTALQQAMASGKPLQGLVVEVYQPGSSWVVSQRIRLQQPMIMSIQVSGDLVPTETITFIGTQVGN
jgi:type VI protein secretion system component Hcp